VRTEIMAEVLINSAFCEDCDHHFVRTAIIIF